MIRSTLLYRKLWYVRRRNAIRMHVFSKLIIILAILAIIASLTGQRLMPDLAAKTREKAEAVITLAVKDFAKEEYFGMVYEELTTVVRDDSGDIISVRPNPRKQSELEANADNVLNDTFRQTSPMYVETRLGAVMGDKFSGLGPLIKVNIHFSSKPKSKLVFKYVTDEENRIVQKVYIHVRMLLEIEAPLNYKTVEASGDVFLAESVLSGHILENTAE